MLTIDRRFYAPKDPYTDCPQVIKDGINLSDIATPREYAGTIKETFFSMVPFYYLKELLEKNFTQTNIDKLLPILALTGSSIDKINQLKTILSNSVLASL